jgi:hypothetical protein
MVYKATLNNISVISVLLVEETGVPRDNIQFYSKFVNSGDTRRKYW